jgi:predicted Zn-dependent protease
MANMPQYGGNVTWIFIAGVSAAKMNDLTAADAAQNQLAGMRQKLESEGKAYDAKSIAIMEKELAALTRLARGQKEDAVKAAKEAVDIELTMSPPSGPPDPIKPALELYGEILLEAGRADEAASAFSESLLRMPLRTPSVLGLARAAAKTGDTTTARQSYQELVAMAGASPSAPAVQEAQKFLKTSH